MSENFEGERLHPLIFMNYFGISYRVTYRLKKDLKF